MLYSVTNFADMKPGYESKQIPHVSYTKFLEMIIDNSLFWKLHI